MEIDFGIFALIIAIMIFNLLATLYLWKKLQSKIKKLKESHKEDIKSLGNEKIKNILLQQKIIELESKKLRITLNKE